MGYYLQARGRGAYFSLLLHLLIYVNQKPEKKDVNIEVKESISPF